MAAISDHPPTSASADPIVDLLDLDRYVGQDPDQIPEAMLSDLDQTYDPDKAPYGEMRPPPIGRFPDRDTLVDSIRQFTLSQGYGIVLQSASKDRKAYIRCIRSGKPEFNARSMVGPKLRTRGSLKTDCPFRVYIFRTKASNGQWELKVLNAEHNHDADDPVMFHQARKLTDGQMEDITLLSKASVPPGRIYELIREKAPLTQPILPRDIRNALALIRRDEVAPSTLLKPCTKRKVSTTQPIIPRGIGNAISLVPRDQVAPSTLLQHCTKRQASTTQPSIPRDTGNVIALVPRNEVAPPTPPKPCTKRQASTTQPSIPRDIGNAIALVPRDEVAPSTLFKPYTKRKAPSKCSGCGGAHTIRQCGKPPKQKKQKRG